MTPTDPPDSHTRLQLHWIIQVLDAFAKRHVEPEPLWRHIALRREDDAWWSSRAPSGTRLGLRFADGVLVLDAGAAGLTEIETEARPLDDVRRRVQSLLGKVGLEGELTLRDASKMPEPSIQAGGRIHLDLRALRRLDELYALAWDTLVERRATYADAAPVLLWPHHFDVSVMRTLHAGARPDGEDARTMTWGFSPGDASYDEPYWYVTPWPYPADPDLAKLPIGAWHTTNWVGAVLTWSVGAGDADAVGAFIDGATPAVEGLLERPS